MAETLPTAEEEESSCMPLDMDALRRRVEELLEMRTDLLRRGSAESFASSELGKLMQECFADLQNRSEEIDAEEPALRNLASEDLEMYVKHLKEELDTIEQRKDALSHEILTLNAAMDDRYSRLESSLLRLDNLLTQTDIQGCHGCQDTVAVDVSGLSIAKNTSTDYCFKNMELDNLIEKSRGYASSLEDIQHELERNEAMRLVEDKFSDIEVMDFEGNCIRLTLKTCIKPLEGLLENFDAVFEPSIFEHELLLEVTDTMELKNLKVFPADVPLDDVIDSAKSSRYSLRKTISHVQQKIRLCTLRRLLVRNANDSRHSMEYMDGEETIVAHLAGGIVAHIKLPQGWPMSGSEMELISIKGSSSDNSISPSLLFKIKELANSLDPEVRWDLSRFIESIEALVRETHSALDGN